MTPCSVGKIHRQRKLSSLFLHNKQANMNSKIQQRANIKLCVKNNLTPIKTYQMLKTSFKENCYIPKGMFFTGTTISRMEQFLKTTARDGIRSRNLHKNW